MLVKLEWLGYRMVKKLWRYVKPFSSDTGMLRTDWRTDGHTELLSLTRDKNDITFWLIFGLSPNLGLSDSLSERLVQKVKWPSVRIVNNSRALAKRFIDTVFTISNYNNRIRGRLTRRGMQSGGRWHWWAVTSSACSTLLNAIIRESFTSSTRIGLLLMSLPSHGSQCTVNVQKMYSPEHLHAMQ